MFACNMASTVLQIINQLRFNVYLVVISQMAIFANIAVHQSLLFRETYYVLFQLGPQLNYSTNFLALIDSYDQLILLDLLFFYLLFAEVMLYVIISVFLDTEDFLDIFSFEYNWLLSSPDLFYGLYVAFSEKPILL